MKVEWSADALADLDRFAAFLHRHHPALANIVGAEILKKASVLAERPMLGHQIAGRKGERGVVMRSYPSPARGGWPAEGGSGGV